VCRHHEAVEAERHARAIRQPMGKRRKQSLVERVAGKPALAPRFEILRESAALFHRIAKFAESIRKLEAVHVELEALRDL
jgi:hypothetical protein